MITNPVNIELLMDNLSRSERDEMLRELLSHKHRSREVRDVIYKWEETAEINSDPKLKRKIIRRGKELEKHLKDFKFTPPRYDQEYIEAMNKLDELNR